MRKILVILWMLIIPVVVCAEQENLDLPYKFNTENIPFGKSIDEVLKMVEGASVNAVEDSNFPEASYYESIRKHFKGGLFVPIMPPGRINLASEVVKIYNINSDKWDGINHVRAYFTGTDETGYTLFMVSKSLSINGKYEPTYRATVNSISGKLGKNYKTEQTKEVVYPDDGYGDVISTPSTVTIWDNKIMKTILFSNKGFFNIGFSGDILYVSKSGWSKYSSLASKTRKAYQNKHDNENKKKLKDI